MGHVDIFMYLLVPDLSVRILRSKAICKLHLQQVWASQQADPFITFPTNASINNALRATVTVSVCATDVAGCQEGSIRVNFVDENKRSTVVSE